MTKEAKVLIGVAAVVVAGGVLLAIFANPQPVDPGKPVDQQSLLRETSHMTKQASAKVNIIEFGDFQCPACGAAHPIIKQMLDLYKDNSDVNFVFRNFPLDSIHPNAHISSEAAEAAGAQGKYWEMHDKLYEKQSEWDTQPTPIDLFVRYAQEIGVPDVDKFRSEVSSRRYSEVINTDYADGEAAGVNSTPTFFINGEKNNKVLSLEEFKTKIDALLTQPVPTPTPTPTAAQ